MSNICTFCKKNKSTMSFLNKKLNNNIFVINLSKDTKRFKNISFYLGINKIIGKQFIAINGKNENIEFLQQYYNIQNKNDFQTNGEAGCAASHLILWEKFINFKNDLLLVFEDDIFLVNNFSNIIEDSWNKIPNDFDIIFLTWQYGSKHHNIYKKEFETIIYKNNQYTIYKLNPVPFCLGGYIIKKSIVKKLLKEIPLKMAIDTFLSKQKLNAYGIHYNNYHKIKHKLGQFQNWYFKGICFPETSQFKSNIQHWLK